MTVERLRRVGCSLLDLPRGFKEVVFEQRAYVIIDRLV
jgi:hypothetical protein